MRRVDLLRRIVVTGPESTGKTELSETLSKHLSGVLMPEFARSYIENLNRPYVYNDLEVIARHQIEEESRLVALAGDRILILDTWLIITKVWFEVVYGAAPDWVIDYIKSSNIDLFLICKPDLPWIPDPVRENGGVMREKLFNRYCKEIEEYGFKYGIVEGFGEERIQNAMQLIKTHGLD
jgi:nicotinamide riboside kinase